MWKRERMMVDVISLQKPEEEAIQHSPPITQNRHYYAFQGLHDRQTRFYPGIEYDVFGVVDDKKRPLTVDDEKHDNKKQKITQSTPTPSFTFSSKPYDAMENLMYYY